MKKPSLLERLTGSSPSHEDKYEDLFEEEQLSPSSPPEHAHSSGAVQTHESLPDESLVETIEGELGVDVYQTPDHVVIKALVAGVIPSNLDISVSRDMITIKGQREDEKEVEGDNYFQRELFWGTFSRTIILPEEVDPDEADAQEKHGILVIRLPKINRNRSTKIKVKSR